MTMPLLPGPSVPWQQAHGHSSGLAGLAGLAGLGWSVQEVARERTVSMVSASAAVLSSR
jgi:hypothetical protein